MTTSISAEGSIDSASGRETLAENAKKWNGSSVMDLLHFYSKRLGLFTSMSCKQKSFDPINL